MHFASLLSGGFITAIVVNPTERKLAKSTFVEWVGFRKAYVIVRMGREKCLRPITRWVGGVKKG